MAEKYIEFMYTLRQISLDIGCLKKLGAPRRPQFLI